MSSHFKCVWQNIFTAVKTSKQEWCKELWSENLQLLCNTPHATIGILPGSLFLNWSVCTRRPSVDSYVLQKQSAQKVDRSKGQRQGLVSWMWSLRLNFQAWTRLRNLDLLINWYSFRMNRPEKTCRATTKYCVSRFRGRQWLEPEISALSWVWSANKLQHRDGQLKPIPKDNHDAKSQSVSPAPSFTSSPTTIPLHLQTFLLFHPNADALLKLENLLNSISDWTRCCLLCVYVIF